MRITAPLQWGSRPGEAAGFHLRLDAGGGHTISNESTENLEVRIPSEEVLEALESMRRAQVADEESHYSDFRIRRRPQRRSEPSYFFLKFSLITFVLKIGILLPCLIVKINQTTIIQLKPVVHFLRCQYRPIREKKQCLIEKVLLGRIQKTQT